MEAVLDVRLSIPESDYPFLGELVTEKGWSVEAKESVLEKYIASRPKNVELSDEEILSEVYAVRYGK